MAVFTNQATLSYNGNSINSNIVTGNLVEVLTATKTAIRPSFNGNDNITYVVSLTNSGTAPLTGVTITDNLGSYDFNGTTLVPLDYLSDSVTYYQNGVLQATPTVTDTNPLTITPITVPAGGNAIIIYEAKANEFAPLATGSTITNEISVTGGGIATAVTTSGTVAVSDEPVLDITKSLSPLNVTDNSDLTYTFTLTNTGNTAADAGDNVVITDTFDPILSNIVVTLNGATLPTSAYTYNDATGEFATVAGQITVPAAAYTQNPTTGEFTVTPGVATLTVTGTV